MSGASLSANSHFARFYESETPLLDEVCEFADQALSAGGSAIIIARRDRVAAFEQRLRESAKNGRLLVLSAEDTLDKITVDGWPVPASFNNVVGVTIAKVAGKGKPVHAFGEMVGVLCAKGAYDAAIELERLWNGLRTRHAFSLFCGYSAGPFLAAEHKHAFKALCDAHDHVRTTQSLL